MGHMQCHSEVEYGKGLMRIWEAFLEEGLLS